MLMCSFDRIDSFYHSCLCHSLQQICCQLIRRVQRPVILLPIYTVRHNYQTPLVVIVLPLNKQTKLTKIQQKCLVDYPVISSNSILNYWLSLCSKCPPFALTRTKTRAPLPDCRINNTPIQFIPSSQDTRTQFIDVLDPPFNHIACSIISCLVIGIFMPKNHHDNKVLSFGTRGSGHHVVKGRTLVDMVFDC